MRFRIEDLPETAQKRVKRLLGVLPHDASKPVVTAQKKAVSVDRVSSIGYPKGKLTKSEERFYDAHLRADSGDGLTLVLAQQVRVPLPGGGTYVPDFVVIEGGIVIVYEVKGGYRGPGWEQGYERYKRAAAYLAKYGVKCVIAEWNKEERNWRCTEWKRLV